MSDLSPLSAQKRTSTSLPTNLKFQQPAVPICRETGCPGRSHSASFDHRRRPEMLRTAMAKGCKNQGLRPHRNFVRRRRLRDTLVGLEARHRRWDEVRCGHCNAAKGTLGELQALARRGKSDLFEF